MSLLGYSREMEKFVVQIELENGANFNFSRVLGWFFNVYIVRLIFDSKTDVSVRIEIALLLLKVSPFYIFTACLQNDIRNFL